MGESGCGKTTLGRTIIRLYNPSSGEVTFGGRIISGKKDAELQKFLTSNIAMVFQDPIASLNPRMTVQEIIAEGLKIKGIKDEATVRNMVGEALYRVGLCRSMLRAIRMNFRRTAPENRHSAGAYS